MSAVLLALFNDLGNARQLRTLLVRDGFPTDRVELTAHGEAGRAGLQPAASEPEQFRRYFGTLFDLEGERAFVDVLAERVSGGALSAVAVHPRGELETSRAGEIMRAAGALEVVPHDLASQRFEHAASSGKRPMLENLLPHAAPDTHCLYCWLFPQGPDHRH